MDDATIALVVMSISLLAIFLGFLIWGIRSGQFKNSEEAKYQIFEKTAKEKDQPGNTQSPEEDPKC